VEPDVVFWSGAQPVENGGFIKAPGGRPFFQIQIDFSSADPSSATLIRNLRFEYSAPQIISRAGGEIAPAVDVKAGQDTAFVLAVEAVLAPGDNGFNRLQVFTPARIGQVESFRVDLGDGQAQELQRLESSDPKALPGEGQFKTVFVDDKQFVLAFPAIGPRQDGATREAQVKVRFRGRVLEFRTNIRANAMLDSLGQRGTRLYTSTGIVALGETGADTLAFFLPQALEAQDVVNFLATDQLEDRNSLSVLADISAQSRELITNLRVAPNPFTPNGDQINDQVMIAYDVQRLLIPRPLKIEIFDLGGRQVKSLRQNADSGGYTQTWDGRDNAGGRVAPGLYLLRISTEADAAGSAQVRLISVAY